VTIQKRSFGHIAGSECSRVGQTQFELELEEDPAGSGNPAGVRVQREELCTGPKDCSFSLLTQLPVRYRPIALYFINRIQLPRYFCLLNCYKHHTSALDPTHLQRTYKSRHG
jgi:hypothetical protein